MHSLSDIDIRNTLEFFRTATVKGDDADIFVDLKNKYREILADLSNPVESDCAGTGDDAEPPGETEE